MHFARDFHDMQKFFTLAENMMSTNGVTFLTNFLRKIRLFTPKHIKSFIAIQLTSSSTEEVKLYAKGSLIASECDGFEI